MQGQGLSQRHVASSLLRWGHAFCLINVFIALVVAVPFLLLAPKPTSPQGHIYQFISWVGHVGFLNFVVYLLALFPLSVLWPKSRFIVFAGAVIATLGQALLFLDTEVFRLFKFHLNPTVVSFLLDMPIKEFPTLFYKTSLFFLFIGALEFLCAYRLYHYMARQHQKSRIMQVSTAGILLAFISTHISHIWADAIDYTPITVQKPNFPLSYPMTAKTFLTKYGWLHTQDYQSRTATLLHTNSNKHLNYPTEPLITRMQATRHNILLIIVRSLPYNLVSPTLMPHLTQYAANNLNFQQHYSGSNESDLALYTLFYSLTPNYWSEIASMHQSPVLIEELLRQDYQLGFFSTHSFDMPLFTQGIQTTIRTHTSHTLESEITSNQAAVHRWHAWLSQTSAARPWFTYLEIDPKTFVKPLFNAQKMQTYPEQITHIDTLIGSLLEQLRLEKSLEDTIVIITSDTGGLNINNAASDSPHFNPKHMHIPFIIGWPHIKSKSIAYHTSHFDLVPTLLKNTLGVTTDPNSYALGQDLHTTPERDWILAGNTTDYAIYDGQILTSFNLQGEFEVFENSQLSSKRPNMALVMQIMDDLSRFHHEP